MIDWLAEKFHIGGPLVMASITAVLLLALAITIERCYRYWIQYDLSNTAGFMAAIQKMIMNNSIENAIRMCKRARPKLLPYVLSEGLKRANNSAEEIDNAIHHASLSVIPKINKLIGILGTLANVATLLGLLGTIFGLMKSFGGAATATGAQKQTILAEGISEALTATSYGLSAALFCILMHGLLTMKQQAIVAEIQKNSAKLTDILFTRSIKIKGYREK
ncbi:MAG: MotA/TolQ/ExbB proton channel family protein [Zetaproteobacteria bacterium]|nr:MotA/TolQ/ExbB proton channel family protein [Zetaproteobacteria bacterium]